MALILALSRSQPCWVGSLQGSALHHHDNKPMARINTSLSADEISRLIDGLEGTSHLDSEAIDPFY